MKALGWSLIIAGVALHFSLCTWGGGGPSKALLIMEIRAREHFQLETKSLTPYEAQYEAKYDLTAAALWGLVLPIVMVGGGICIASLPVSRAVPRVEKEPMPKRAIASGKAVPRGIGAFSENA